MEKQEQPTFMDAESAQNMTYQGLSFRDIVLNHLRKVAQLGSCEFHGGFWQVKQKAMGGSNVLTEEVYVPNTREEYNNAVDVLSDLCYPHFDKETKEKEEQYEKELQELKEEYRQERALVDRDSKGIELQKLNLEFDKDKLAIKRKLFRELSCFLKKKNYFADEVIEE